MAFENLQPWAYAISTIAFVVGTSTIFLRLYCRWRLRMFGSDDFVAIGLFFINSLQQAIQYVFLHFGCGIHLAELPAGKLQRVIEWLFVEEVYYMFIHWTVKQAFLLFYLRLSPQKNFRITVYAMMGLNTLFTITNWLLAFLQCRPLDAMVHPEAHPDAQCMSQYVVMMIPTALNALMDIIILVLPIPTVLGLRMSRKRKAAVLGVICFGLLSVVTALCRFSLQIQLANNPDTTYVMGRMIIAASVEIEVAIVAVNLPALKSLFTKFVGSTVPGYSSSAPKMSEYKNGSGKGLKGSSGSSYSQRMLGGEFSKSEEDLFRTAVDAKTGNIKVTTNVEISSEHNRDDNNYLADIEFSAPRGMANGLRKF